MRKEIGELWDRLRHPHAKRVTNEIAAVYNAYTGNGTLGGSTTNVSIHIGERRVGRLTKGHPHYFDYYYDWPDPDPGKPNVRWGIEASYRKIRLYCLSVDTNVELVTYKKTLSNSDADYYLQSMPRGPLVFPALSLPETQS